ncbi:MAG: hypothetical protein GEU88_15795 [Solirubrobacterales bacterium]|nr:hypothetical protein [Solirubrobacterales bacterium]
MRITARALALALALALVGASVASATVYRGAGADDARMPVKLKVLDGVVTFSYSEVLTRCSNGDRVRYPGANHSAALRRNDRFRDTITDDGQSSVVRGSVGPRHATGTIRYQLAYPGGECHSGEVEWTAKVR